MKTKITPVSRPQTTEVLLAALKEIAAYPVSVEGYNSASALMLRMTAMQTCARLAIDSASK